MSFKFFTAAAVLNGFIIFGNDVHNNILQKKWLLFQLKDMMGLYYFKSSALVKTKWVVNMEKDYNYYDILNNGSHSHAIDDYWVLTPNHKGEQYTSRCDWTW